MKGGEVAEFLFELVEKLLHVSVTLRLHQHELASLSAVVLVAGERSLIPVTKFSIVTDLSLSMRVVDPLPVVPNSPVLLLEIGSHALPSEIVQEVLVLLGDFPGLRDPRQPLDELRCSV